MIRKTMFAVATVAAIGAAALIPTEASAGGGKGGGGMGGGYHGHGHWGGGFGGISSPLTFKRFGHAINTDEVFGTHRLPMPALVFAQTMRVNGTRPSRRAAAMTAGYILPRKNRQILGASLAYGGLPVIIDTLLGQVKLGITHSAIALNPIFIKRATSGRISSLSA